MKVEEPPSDNEEWIIKLISSQIQILINQRNIFPENINGLKITSQRYIELGMPWVKSMKCEDAEYAVCLATRQLEGGMQ